MLYTKKGDDGTTKTFGCDQRISKNSLIAEALGSLDEINSFLGLVKVKAGDISFTLEKETIDLSKTINTIQQDLFIIQAELAGASKTIIKEKVEWLEYIINDIEKTLPPIKTFFVSGGTELSTLCDISRTIARRAERRVVAVIDEQKSKSTSEQNISEQKNAVSRETQAYLNRLSSILYAFARAVNHYFDVVEETPKYN